MNPAAILWDALLWASIVAATVFVAREALALAKPARAHLRRRRLDRRARRQHARVGVQVVEGYIHGVEDHANGRARPVLTFREATCAQSWAPDMGRQERAARAWILEVHAYAWARDLGWQHASRGHLVSIATEELAGLVPPPAPDEFTLDLGQGSVRVSIPRPLHPVMGGGR